MTAFVFFIEMVRSLFDFRLIHLVQRGYADKDNPGLRYNIYTLDYGTYVDLLGTKTAPVDDFTETLEDGEQEVVVPFDDRRSIRRIILRRHHLEVRGRTSRGPLRTLRTMPVPVPAPIPAAVAVTGEGRAAGPLWA